MNHLRVRLKPDTTRIGPRVRLKPDTTGIGPNNGAHRDRRSTLNGSVRLQADRFRWHSALALSLLAAVSCSQPAPERGVITVAMYTSVNSLDPRYATDAVSSRAHRLLYNSLLNLDSSLQARQELARELHYSGDINDSAAMNIWLHKQVMRKLEENGGKVPDDLKN